MQKDFFNQFSSALRGQVVVVTGGAGRLGSEIVKTICCSGGVAVVADQSDSAPSVFQTFQKEFPEAIIDFYKVDINSKEDVSCLIQNASQKFGRIDAVVNNAYPRNRNYGRHLLEVEYSDFCENVNKHLGGYFLTSQLFCKFFKKQGFGNVVNVSSVYGLIAPRFEIYKETEMTMPVEYAVIKSAIIHMTRYFAAYFKGSGIRINCISPGGILWNQPKSFLNGYNSFCCSKGMLSPNDLMGAFLLLLSDAGKYMNGQNIVVDDGFCL